MAKPSSSARTGSGLFDRLLCKPAVAGAAAGAPPGLAGTARARASCGSSPRGHLPHFRAATDNAHARRRCRSLALGATAPNTCDSRRVEAVRLDGPLPTDERTRRPAAEVDKNMRLDSRFPDDSRPQSHRTLTSRQRGLPLGLAVAASACVPISSVVFRPLP